MSVIDFNAKTQQPQEPSYFNYEIVKKLQEGQTEPTVLRDFGVLIANGIVYAIAREEQGRMEFIVCTNAEDVDFARSTGKYNAGRALDA